jgi:hypothetical protein
LVRHLSVFAIVLFATVPDFGAVLPASLDVAAAALRELASPAAGCFFPIRAVGTAAWLALCKYKREYRPGRLNMTLAGE